MAHRNQHIGRGKGGHQQHSHYERRSWCLAARFENGFVLVNPLPQARTFSAAELAGTLHRTGIHRINGSQAPDINNGQAVTDDLTLGAFDAIILLADPICAPLPNSASTETFPDLTRKSLRCRVAPPFRLPPRR